MKFQYIEHISQWTPVEVKWMDIMGYEGWWSREKVTLEIASKDIMHRSVGYFYEADKNVIIIVMSSRDDSDNDISSLGESLAIPMVSVRSVMTMVAIEDKVILKDS